MERAVTCYTYQLCVDYYKYIIISGKSAVCIPVLKILLPDNPVMGRYSGKNCLGSKIASRSNYISARKKDAIRKAVAARRSKVTKALPKQQFNSSRVIDLSKLAVNIQKITSHSASCGGSCTVDGEIYRAGLASIIQVTCTKCDTVFHIESSSRFTDKSGKKYWTVNLGAVLGQMAIGGGASHLTQTMISLGTPSMSKHTFTSTERYLSEEIEKMLAKSMIEAGKKEREHAIANNRYFQGVPAITVIADGGWSKRSHKHSYNAKSGVAVIIGQHTKKLLYFGIRNKYCTTCSIAKNSKKEPPTHKCYRNWNSSSPAMESDILVEGFKQAESVHQVRYMFLIGDGDSSVLHSIHTKVPVWGRYIQKIECANHALKNYRSKLEAIVKDNKGYKGKHGLSQKQIKRLTSGARAAIRMHSQTRNIDQLRHDLRNGPYHVFGDHSKCNKDFCKIIRLPHLDDGSIIQEAMHDENSVDGEQTIRQQLEDIIMQEHMDDLSPESLLTQDEDEACHGFIASLDQLPEGLLHKVLRAGDRLVSLASQLIDNQTSNLAEAYMGLKTYFDGGKIYNRIQSGSFQSRCFAAGLKFQKGPQWINHVYVEYSGHAPLQPLLDIANTIKDRQERENKRKNTAKYK